MYMYMYVGPAYRYGIHRHLLYDLLLPLSQQPIYETLERISPTERDLMMKLEKSQMRVVEVSAN